MLNNKSKLVLKKHFVDNFKVSLWFFGIFVIVMVLIHMLNFIDGDSSGPIEMYYCQLVVNSSRVFLLVIGIATYSTEITEFLYQGVTRKDYYKGMIISVILLSLMFVLALALAMFVDYIFSGLEPYPLLLIVCGIAFFPCYMVGRMIAMSFYKFGVIIGLVSIVFSVLCYNFLYSEYVEDSFESIYMYGAYSKLGQTGTLVSLLLPISVAIITLFINYRLNRNTSIKIRI